MDCPNLEGAVKPAPAVGPAAAGRPSNKHENRKDYLSLCTSNWISDAKTIHTLNSQDTSFQLALSIKKRKNEFIVGEGASKYTHQSECQTRKRKERNNASVGASLGIKTC